MRVTLADAKSTSSYNLNWHLVLSSIAWYLPSFLLVLLQELCSTTTLQYFQRYLDHSLAFAVIIFGGVPFLLLSRELVRSVDETASHRLICRDEPRRPR